MAPVSQDPQKRSRSRRTAWVLLAVPLILWAFALLYLLRVISVFDFLMDFPGPLVVFSSMALLPLAALIHGTRIARAPHGRRFGRSVAAAGGVLTFAFISVIGIPMAVDVLDPGTPLNPTEPSPVEPLAGIPVFPGAEGFGSHTPAGRGGQVIEVTTLADNGPGSLREAANVPGPRIIVFRVGGVIELQDFIYINEPFVTVAGQTAPGGGITLKNAGLVITTHDVLVQHLRIRPGNEGRVTPEGNDAIALLGAHGDVTGAHHVVIDHVSASWSEDELLSTWYGPHDITVSWSIFSEALNRSRHVKGTHSAGLLVGDGSDHVTMHHNLLAHNDFRNPLLAGGGTHEFVNNVVYDWGVLPTEITDDFSNTFLNLVGNLYLPGPSINPLPFEILLNQNDRTSAPRLFVQGNLGPHRSDPSLEDWLIVGLNFDGRVAPESYRAALRFVAPPVTEWGALDLSERLLPRVGASAPVRDAIDERIVCEVLSGEGSIIDSPSEVGGYPDFALGQAPVDSDHDGMPDAWEADRGLDSDDPRDGAQDPDGDGYTHIEDYLYWLTQPGE